MDGANSTGPYGGLKCGSAAAPGIPPKARSARTSRGAVSMSVSSPHDTRSPLPVMSYGPRAPRPSRRVLLVRLSYGPAPSTAPEVEDHQRAAQGLAPATKGRLTYQRHSDLTRVADRCFKTRTPSLQLSHHHHETC